MNPQLELNLGLVLFLPWFLVLAALFWAFPRQPRHWPRRLFDLASLGLATVAFLYALHAAQAYADPAHGKMWRQILATSVGYGVFLGVLLVAVVARRLLWHGRPGSA